MTLASRILMVAHDAPPEVVTALRHHGALEAPWTDATPATVPMTTAALKKLPVTEAAAAVAYLPAEQLSEVFDREKRKAVRIAVLARPDLPAALAVRAITWACAEDGVSAVYERQAAVKPALARLGLPELQALSGTRAWWHLAEPLSARLVACFQTVAELDATLGGLAERQVEFLLAAGLTDPGALGYGVYLDRIGQPTAVLAKLRSLPGPLVVALLEYPAIAEALREMRSYHAAHRFAADAVEALTERIGTDDPQWVTAFRLLSVYPQLRDAANRALTERQIAELTPGELVRLGFSSASHPAVRLRRVFAELGTVAGQTPVAELVEATLACRDPELVVELLDAVVTHGGEGGLEATGTAVIQTSQRRWPELLADAAVRQALQAVPMDPAARLALLGPEDPDAFTALVRELVLTGAALDAELRTAVLRALAQIPLDDPALLLELLALLPNDGLWLASWEPTGATPRTPALLAAWLVRAPHTQVHRVLELLGGWDATNTAATARLLAEESFARSVLESPCGTLTVDELVPVCCAHPALGNQVLTRKGDPARLAPIPAVRAAITLTEETTPAVLASYVTVPPATEAEWARFDLALTTALADLGRYGGLVRELLTRLPLDETRLCRVLDTGTDRGGREARAFQPQWARDEYPANPYTPAVLDRLLADGAIHANAVLLVEVLMTREAGRALLAADREFFAATRGRPPATLAAVRAVYELLAERLGTNTLAWEQALSLADEWNGSVAMLAEVALAASA